MHTTALEYQSGFLNRFSSEAEKGALPIGQNSPQKPPLGLYAEQLSGSAFTRSRQSNRFSWVYRILPSVKQGDFQPIESRGLYNSLDIPGALPNQMRWDPLPTLSQKTNFFEGIHTFLINGNAQTKQGAQIHLYQCNASMDKTFFYNADAEMLIVPYEGDLLFKTECGQLHISPGEVLLIPQGLRFQVDTLSPHCGGYLLENFGEPFVLPELGPIGANGLANPNHFLYPHAWYEDKEGDFQLIAKFAQKLWQAPISHSPLNVVAWRGNYAPCKYDLTKFNTINTVSFDHPDPSIFTVLTSPSPQPGEANVDFVIFPSRWLVAENTFRPPYYHRNIMSEYMGLIYGVYDAKEEGFVPGGGSLHNCMSAHGPDTKTFLKAQETPNTPQKLDDTLSFMFESNQAFSLTPFAQKTQAKQVDYVDCWQDLPKNFQTPR